MLTLHYRGSWGSPGTFSIANALEDTDAAVAFLRSPGVAEKYGIDLDRLVIGGHSLGGFAAAMHAKGDSHLRGVLLLDPADIGTWGEMGRKASPEERAAAKADFDDLGNSLGWRRSGEPGQRSRACTGQLGARERRAGPAPPIPAGGRRIGGKRGNDPRPGRLGACRVQAGRSRHLAHFPDRSRLRGPSRRPYRCGGDLAGCVIRQDGALIAPGRIRAT
ncbi:alpha/beta fold hydrolase [Pseudoxanthomonas sp. NC8]|nr:alpha/beta fold hydrolase [Pseudoxanthomonas sp. NC8]